MEVIKSNKGGNKICWRGYTYIMKHQGRKRLTWRCTKESSLKCRGTMYTDFNIGHPQIGKVHSHIADKHEVNAIKCTYKMKEAAKRTKTNPAEIYAENVKNLDPQSQARVPPEPIMKRTIRNQRKTEHPASGKLFLLYFLYFTKLFTVILCHYVTTTIIFI